MDVVQQRELELARMRSERAKKRRKEPFGMEGEEWVVPELAKKPKAANNADSDGEESDGDMSKLTAEEQAQVMAAGGGDANSANARKLRRLLRNRMSAQQARERKKVYVVNLEEQVKNQQKQISEMENKLRHYEMHNSTLRRIIQSMRGEGADVAPVNY